MSGVTFYPRAENDPREVTFCNSDGETVVIDFSSGSATVEDAAAIQRLTDMAADPNHPVSTTKPKKETK